MHETITPVIQRDTHEHRTVHNVIPVHEKIHECVASSCDHLCRSLLPLTRRFHSCRAPVVHESTVLPTVSLDEFKGKVHGETHGDKSHHHSHFQGEPRSAPGQASEGTIGSHAGAPTIDSKAAGHHHSDRV